MVLTILVLYQDRWFHGESRADLVAPVKVLPIFEVGLPLPESPGHPTSDVANFVTLRDSALHLIPAEAPHEGTLNSKCILPASDTERSVLERHFRVSSWTLANFYRQAPPALSCTFCKKSQTSYVL